MHFVVCIPTFNRAHTLARAIDSVLAQTYTNFTLVVWDDGSTDATPELMKGYVERDERVIYKRFEHNQGAVVMDSLGMHDAIKHGDVWTRLGSDDWFLPTKLFNDAVVLETSNAMAVHGDQGVYAADAETLLWVRRQPALDARHVLFNERIFICSWGNMAVRVQALRDVLAKYGDFVPPELHHVNDLVFNARLLRLHGWVWRPVCDGIWMFGGATTTQPAYVAAETELSWQIIDRENEAFYAA